MVSIYSFVTMTIALLRVIFKITKNAVSIIWAAKPQACLDNGVWQLQVVYCIIRHSQGMGGAARSHWDTHQNKSRYSYKVGRHTVQLYLQASPMYSKTTRVMISMTIFIIKKLY